MSDCVYIGLGSNLGDRERQLARAVEALSRIDAVAVVRRSSLYDSAPVGPPQPRYLNAVVEIDCALSPQRMLGILKQIEVDLGREAADKWAPRAIDLDILLWEGQLVADANLQVPHLELHKRRFVLEPLVELEPLLAHPVLRESMAQLLASVAKQDVVRLDSAQWPGVAAEEEAR